MIERKLRDLEIMVQGSGLKDEYRDIYIKGVSTDSRTIGEGQLFIPLVGEFYDGHDFIDEATARGAIASFWHKDKALPPVKVPLILVDDSLVALQRLAKEYREQLDVKIIGITGSNGKTTTKDILASLLNTKYKTQKTKGNLNNLIGVPLTLLDLKEDTEVSVVEMATDKLGEISTLTSLVKPDIAIITNIGEAHLEDLINKENIAKAKLEILEELSPKGLLIYFGDDALLKKKIGELEIRQRIVTYGGKESNDYRCELERVDEEGIGFTLKNPSLQDLFLPLLGKHNMYNATAAIVVAKYYGLSDDLIREGLLHVEKTEMRNELVYAEGFTILNDSYKSNPSSVLVALDTLYQMDQYSQRIAVLGDMLGLGQEEIQMHKEIGQKIDSENIDYLFTIGPFAQYIAESAKPNFRANRIICCKDKSQVVEELKKVIIQNSLILVKASRPLELEELVDRLKNELILPIDSVS